MLKPKRLNAPTATILQPTASPFRPHLVFTREEGSGSAAKGRTARILIVEDDYLVSGEMEAELSAAGFEIVGIATSAHEAIRLARDEKPHLVVMDIRLEGARDGVDAAVEIFKTAGIRSLFASAYQDIDTRRRAEIASPLGWLAKPYTMMSLVSAVRAALRNVERD